MFLLVGQELQRVDQFVTQSLTPSMRSKYFCFARKWKSVRVPSDIRCLTQNSMARLRLSGHDGTCIEELRK